MLLFSVRQLISKNNSFAHVFQRWPCSYSPCWFSYQSNQRFFVKSINQQFNRNFAFSHVHRQDSFPCQLVPWISEMSWILMAQQLLDRWKKTNPQWNMFPVHQRPKTFVTSKIHFTEAYTIEMFEHLLSFVVTDEKCILSTRFLACFESATRRGWTCRCCWQHCTGLARF